METKETDGPVLPLLIYDNQGILRLSGLTNTKGYNKSLENGLLWALDGSTGRLLPLTDIDASYAASLLAAGRNVGARCVETLRKHETSVIAKLDLALASLPELSVPQLESGEAGAVSSSNDGGGTSTKTGGTTKSANLSHKTDRLQLVQFLFELQDTVRARKASMPEGSYTTHLFKAGAGKIRKKTGEEAVELILAQTPDEIASEASDLLYHMMVLFVETGVDIEQVLAELKRR